MDQMNRFTLLDRLCGMWVSRELGCGITGRVARGSTGREVKWEVSARMSKTPGGVER